MNNAMKTYGAMWKSKDSFFNAKKLNELNTEKQNKKNEGKNTEEKNMANIIKQQSALVVEYEVEDGVKIELSPDIIRKYLVNGNSEVTDQEVFMFLQLCRYQRINPFLREAYLVKYKAEKPAQIVCGKELFTKRAEKHPDFDGYEAGVMVLTKDNKIQTRPGTTYLPDFGEALIGGWAKVHRKNYKVVFESTAMFKEYKGAAGSLWDTKPATMIRKVALVQALREAFPDMYGGLYSQEEIDNVNGNELPQEPIEPIVGDEVIDKATENYLLEKFDKDPQFAKKILSGFGYKKLTDVKQCDVEAILAKIAEVKAAQNERSSFIAVPDYITEAQRMTLLAKADMNIIKTVIEQFGYGSIEKIEKKDFDEIIKQTVDMTLEMQYGDSLESSSSRLPWELEEANEIPA